MPERRTMPKGEHWHGESSTWMYKRWHGLCFEDGGAVEEWTGEPDGYHRFREWAEEHGLTREQIIFRLDTEQPHGPGNSRVGPRICKYLNRQVNSTSGTGVKGVTFDKAREKYQAYITLDYKLYRRPRRDTLEEAIADRQELERIYHRPLLEAAS